MSKKHKNDVFKAYNPSFDLGIFFPYENFIKKTLHSIHYRFIEMTELDIQKITGKHCNDSQKKYITHGGVKQCKLAKW